LPLSSLLLAMQEQVFVLSERRPVTPSLRLSSENLKAISWEKKTLPILPGVMIWSACSGVCGKGVNGATLW